MIPIPAASTGAWNFTRRTRRSRSTAWLGTSTTSSWRGSDSCGEDCANELDDDGDGTADCDDPDCAAETGCVTDLDGDGYDGVGADATDCDDTNATVNPGATERCNGVDDDCDGSTDDPSSADALTWYADADQDVYGDPATAAQACTVPNGYGADATDCDDTGWRGWGGSCHRLSRPRIRSPDLLALR